MGDKSPKNKEKRKKKKDIQKKGIPPVIPIAPTEVKK